jgi:glycosyltransferase involved in cell wall biosynthesis
MHQVVVNLRNLQSPMSGVQRYTSELVNRLVDHLDTLAPKRHLGQVQGHAWEQINLPFLCKGRLLWSPANTGPLSVPNQVVTVHDAATLDHPEWFEKKFATWYRFLLPQLVRRAHKVITVSNFSKTRLLAHIPVPDEKIVVIPNGLDSKFKRPTPTHLAEVRHRLQLPDRYILALGSLEPRKNFERLFQAWQQLELVPDKPVLVVAGGSGKVFRSLGFSYVPQGVQVLGRVHDDDLPALYGNAETFIYPALYEGFGLPPLEAMACECPVIVSNTTTLPETCGDAALYCDPYALDDIARSIKQMTQNPTLQNMFRTRGLEHAKHFTWDKSAQRTLEVLYSALNGKRL